ncbi:hypothetical protein L596_014339 [Steinernema carpocapsae]|uniref:Uncharacterized protein n=1 Tax=Steinernema carpocapsae TaxID=34508 RepID=A0A4V6A2W3_STECR|nr:hypothetical protein L596_014339 [Steinernema carpocapsae]
MAKVYGTNSVEEALVHLRKVSDGNPNDPFTLHAVGLQMHAVRYFSEAQKYFQKAEDIKAGFSASNLYYLGDCLRKNGRVDESIECLKKALSLPARNKVDHKGKVAARRLLVICGVGESEIAAVEKVDEKYATNRY